MSEHAGPTTAVALVQDGWNQLHRQLPMAAWACWQQALRIEPGFPPAEAAIDWILQAPELPLAARTPYRFLPPRGADRRDHWNRALSVRDVEHLASAESAFRSLVLSDPDDVEARMNQALCLAWLGRNPESIDALLEVARRVGCQHEPGWLDVQACTLAELLRQGAGAEHLADDLTSTLIVAWTRPTEELIALLARLGPVHALPTAASDRPADAGKSSWFTGEWLDRTMPEASDTLELDAVPRLRSSLLVGQGTARFSLPTAIPAEMARLERVIKITLADQFTPIDRQTRSLPIALMDASVWRIRLPGDLDDETRSRLLREWVELSFEHAWIAQPRRSLATAGVDMLAPAAAARVPPQTDPTLHARLEGLVAFREQLAQRPAMQHLYQGYPFDRLRRRLGLEPRDPTSTEANDVSCLSPDELEALDLSQLDRGLLLEAYQSTLPSQVRARLAGRLIEDEPGSGLSLDFPRAGLLALGAADDPTSLIAEIRRQASGTRENRSRLDLLVALDRFLRDAPDGTQPPVPDDCLFPDPTLIQRVCDVLEEAGAGDAARALEERGIRLALTSSRPWFVPDPQPAWPAHE